MSKAKVKLSENQEKALRGLFKHVESEHIRFASKDLNRVLPSLTDRGLAVGLRINNDATRYRITEAGCDAIGEKMPVRNRYKVIVDVELTAFSPEAVVEIVKDALKYNGRMLTGNSKVEIRKPRKTAMPEEQS